MADDLLVAAPVVDDELKRDDTFLVARNQMELQQCQTKMALWFREQVLVCKRNEHELREAVDTAKRNKWQHSTLQKQLNQSLERKVWLIKCLRAVEAGFAIIPDMPVEVFAVRVSSGAVRQRNNNVASRPQFLPGVAPTILPEGEGKYVSSRPQSRQDYADKKFYSKGLKPVQFPVIAAQTRIMEATEQAMALRVFDEVGIAPPRRRADPMIVGRVRGEGGQNLSFIICWFLDLKQL